MVATISAGTSARYYTAQIEYYLGGREPDGQWLLAGRELGVIAGSLVESASFERLHAALDEDGRPLVRNDGGRTEAVGGYDVTFSPPKSLQVLWGLADAGWRAKLDAVDAAAVQQAMALLDRDAAFCRRGRGGAVLEKVRLTAAAFQHGEARPAAHADGTVFADPALHTHVVILNLAQRADGSFGRLDGRTLFNLKMCCGAVYHQALAAGLMKLGLGVEVTGKNGIFEVVGVDPELCTYFSARRREIENELSPIGLATADAPALAAAKARTTRRAKIIDAAEDRHAFWRVRAAALGFEPEHVVAQARGVGRDRALLRDEVGPDNKRVALAALEELIQRDSLFEHRHLVAALAAAHVGSNAFVSIDAELAALHNDGAVIELDRDRWGHPIYSTPEIVQLEQALFVQATRLGQAKVAAPASHHVARLLAAAGLNAEQEAAARLACGSEAIVTVEGAPGVGKSTLLRPVARAWQDAGWRVIGASTAWKIAHQLRDDLGIDARAIDSWLAGAEHDRAFLTDKTLLVIDESGLITSQQMQRILGKIERARAEGLEVAVRMVGDRRQLQPIGGPGLRIVAEAVGTMRVDTIVRQRESWARNVVTAFGDGRAADALGHLAEYGCVHELDGPASTINALIENWESWRRDHPSDSSLIVAKTNMQVAALNRAVRERLRAAGELAATADVSLAAVTPSGQPVTLDLAEGDRVRFLKRNDILGIVNGTEGRLKSIERAADGRLRLKAQVGTWLVAFGPDDLTDEAGRVQVAHAYATTCYGSQGLTTETAFVLADPAMDRHDIHVAASRSRGATQLFFDRRALDARVQAERLLGDRNREIEPEERIAALADALSRSGVKKTTLDYLTPAQRQTLREQARPLELAQEEPILEEQPEITPEGSARRNRRHLLGEASASQSVSAAQDVRTLQSEGAAPKPNARAPSRRRSRSKGQCLE
ncbi:MobF family relaxase [Aureimonas phyllosphaerae]|uniref:Conjugative relaxase-like TrwC/TraI family protein n=1 Tax=Aureimonas phyllosphaerae TaxID=1166078 RepID=A0A7W6FVQ5_9HYPH|nr:MobF family relaxase [Aureimonas phyllosphaerae]MBB3937396.1 conjugative relaxase-like TrwC/TraI family protein [Aureimonas phyllosphaerae]MBB3961538.1 conjugative relaxase-like TrwC/TraI family protein [Aureimonas phyllosphaerae]SFF39179.1 conjugative relaxase domain-containing protein, TrwC/TraI family [Aureimonas phyllosphaerae]